jgi:hypothetical protein
MERGLQIDRKGRLNWYTDGSRVHKGTGAGMCCHGTKKKLSSSLGQYTTVFQAQMYAIKACGFENPDRN